MQMETIGKNIRKHRQIKNLTIEDLADLAGLSKNYVSLVERGRKIPSLETVIKLINALNVSADEILCDVTNVGYKIHTTELTNRIEKVSQPRREMIYALLEILLKEEA